MYQLRVTLIGCLLIPVVGCLAVHAGEPLRDSRSEDSERRVIFVTLDGLRWQEVFHGADTRLNQRDAGGVRDEDSIRRRFLADDPQERRRQLMPFLTTIVEQQGQLWGNVDQESLGKCANGKYFSYPGYSELIVGYPDERIDSNAKRNNPNVSVLEWLQGMEGYRDRVALYASWDVFPFILNQERSGIRVNAGWQSFEEADPISERLNTLTRELPRVWPGVRYDFLTFEAALNDLKIRKPKVLWVALGETDDWAHDGRYDLYLDAAYRNDQYLQRLWETCQSLDDYRGRTTMIVTVDHGRGDGPQGWKSHSSELAGSEFIWVAMIGPDIPAQGQRVKNTFTQSQIAATIAQALGLDFTQTHSNVAQPLDWD